MNLLLNRPNDGYSLSSSFPSPSSRQSLSPRTGHATSSKTHHPKLLPKPDPHDIQFESYHQKILSLKSSFQDQKSELLRIQKWIKRLKVGNYKYIAQKRNRNLYAKLLIHQMSRGRLDSPPFHVVPPRFEEHLPSLPAYQVAAISRDTSDSPKHRMVHYSLGSSGSGSALVRRNSLRRRRASSVPKRRRSSLPPKSKGLHAHEESVFEYSNGTPVGKKRAPKISFVTKDGVEFSDSPTWKEKTHEPSFSSKVLGKRMVDNSTSDDDSDVDSSGISALRRVSMIPKSGESMMSSNSTTSFTSKRTPFTRTNSSSTARVDLMHHTLSRELSRELDVFATNQHVPPTTEHEQHSPSNRAGSSPLVHTHHTPSPESNNHEGSIHHNDSTPRRSSTSSPNRRRHSSHSPIHENSTIANHSLHIPRPQPIQILNSAFSTPTHPGDVVSGSSQHASSHGSLDPLSLEKQKNRQLQEEVSTLRQLLLEARNHIASLEQDMQKKDEECTYALQQSLHDDQLFMQNIETMLDTHGRSLLEHRNYRKTLPS